MPLIAEIEDKMLSLPTALIVGLLVAFLGLLIGLRSRWKQIAATVVLMAGANWICLAPLMDTIDGVTFGSLMGPKYVAGIASAVNVPGLVVVLVCEKVRACRSVSGT